MNKLLRAWVGDGKKAARQQAAEYTDDPVNTPAPLIANPTSFQYHFNTVPVARQPGPAYHSPLVMYQSYIPNVWEGWGGKMVTDAIARGTQFAAFESLEVAQILQPVTTGGSGTIQGQFFGAPLIDTNPSTTTVG